MRNRIEFGGFAIYRLPVVAEAAIRFGAASRSADTPESCVPRPTMVSEAFADAEALWNELCQRFSDDAEAEPGGMWVVFDGPPGHESGRFVEVEDVNGGGTVSGAEWQEQPKGYWRLGPFYRKGA